MHFVHIRRDPTRPPVLLTHGWPSTFLELLPLADLLDVDVVIPSLPGYLYSDLLDVPMTRKNIGESFHVLMNEILGYERYFAFGGDIGGSACGWLATMHPDEVAGLHVIHGPFPAEYAEPITPAEQIWLDSEDERDETDGGYSAILATRPDTSRRRSWTRPPAWPRSSSTSSATGRTAAATSSPASTRTSLCELLTLYWVTDSIGTSFRHDLEVSYTDEAAGHPGSRRGDPERTSGTCRSSRARSPNGRPATSGATRRPRAAGTSWRSRSRGYVADELTAFMREVG